ncbi:MAG: hypothetical protein ACYTFO_09160, partial [Planctomycetota bacterium]
QGTWVAALLLWKGPAIAYDLGLKRIGLYMDESIFPGMARIARHMDGEVLASNNIMTLNLQVPWPDEKA